MVTLHWASMLPRAYESEHCSIAGTLGIVGDRWTLLILREACFGIRRFADFQTRLGLARTVLSDRLGRLVEEGILERRRYQERPERFEYRLTAKGEDLWPVLKALMSWGDRHVMDGRPPVLHRHRDCGGLITDRRICSRCDTPVELGDVEREPGPGAEHVSRQ
jgi:DNA-binding HxlR family transcriptional regulator